jgi:hypothetical protein
VVGPDFGVKAAGGIRTLGHALAMLEAGANRLGTSASPAILAALPPRQPRLRDESPSRIGVRHYETYDTRSARIGQSCKGLFHHHKGM